MNSRVKRARQQNLRASLLIEIYNNNNNKQQKSTYTECACVGALNR